MTDPATLSKQQLIDLVHKQSKVVQEKELDVAQLKHNNQQLEHNNQQLQKEVAQDKDIIRQLEEKNRQLEKDYAQLFRSKFGRKSERYIFNPDQLRIDFGDTDDAADAADGRSFTGVTVTVTVAGASPPRPSSAM